jgi:glycosyltransferase involved in cell wall biosynthesis
MTGRQPVKVCIVYPADPLGVIPGGIDTFIRGVLRWAPLDIEMSLVGVTTDQHTRPVGRWMLCDLGRTKFRFFPVIALNDPAGRSRVPLSLRFTMGLVRERPYIDADVLEFHRLEPSLVYLKDKRPRTAIMHQNMRDLINRQSDIRWSRCPTIFFWLENRLIHRFSRVYAVREDAVAWYREQYPAYAERFSFLPTWFDPEIFFPVPARDNVSLRLALRRELNFPEKFKIALTVGRLDSQKDPMLIVESFRYLTQEYDNIGLVFVGDGVLREDVESFVCEAGMLDRVRFAGLQSAKWIANMLRASDLFVLGSAYEGMPMCVLEALGTGLPVVATDVGEVRKVVRPGENGFIVEERTPSAIAKAMRNTITALDSFRGTPCTLAVNDYVPERVLAPVYETYRMLARKDDASVR